jgi:hypothetical protein
LLAYGDATDPLTREPQQFVAREFKTKFAGQLGHIIGGGGGQGLLLEGRFVLHPRQKGPGLIEAHRSRSGGASSMPQPLRLIGVTQAISTMAFFEALWHGEGIGDGGDLQEALLAYSTVQSEDGDWNAACASEGAQPSILRYRSFEAYLDNADELETIPVTAAMITAALPPTPADPNPDSPG